jgi:hypothetical protein
MPTNPTPPEDDEEQRPETDFVSFGQIAQRLNDIRDEQDHAWMRDGTIVAGPWS